MSEVIVVCEKDAKSDKSKVVALLLCLFLGLIGAHHFYVGRLGKGILYIFTGGLFLIGCIVDLILISTGKFRESIKLQTYLNVANLVTFIYLNYFKNFKAKIFKVKNV